MGVLYNDQVTQEPVRCLRHGELCRAGTDEIGLIVDRIYSVLLMLGCQSF